MPPLPITLYNSQKIKELEQLAINNNAVSSFELMSRAGYQVFKCLRENYPDVQTIWVFCGTGNNAGDGYIVACLAIRAGLSVTVITLGNPEHISGDALTAYQHYLVTNGRVLPFDPDLAIPKDVIIIDALLGTGLNRTIHGSYTQAIQIINLSLAKVIAVDIPSGLNADTGVVMGSAIKANHTVTFIGVKQGLLTGDAADYCGNIVHSSLALPDELFLQCQTNVFRVVADAFLPRLRVAHKGYFGHVLIVGGEQGYSGAVRLAGEAALRVGAGLVSIATRPEHAVFLNTGCPELMCHGITDSDQLSALLDKVNVVVIGPGLGQSEWARQILSTVLNCKCYLVIDADALNLLAQSSLLRDCLTTQSIRSIITPHVGEAVRLLGWSKNDIMQNRFAAVTALQQQYNSVALLKGAGTLIADETTISVITSGNPGMASGGMGDVLSGVIGGLLAQGFSLPNAAQQGAHIHGLAADLAAQAQGERGLLASDLMPNLRKLVN